MLMRLVKPPSIGDSRLCLVFNKKTNLNSPDQYEFIDLETYKSLTDSGWGCVSSGAHHYNNMLFGCSLKNGIGCSFWGESDRVLEVNGVYDVKFLNNPTDASRGVPKVKVLKKCPPIKKAA